MINVYKLIKSLTIFLDNNFDIALVHRLHYEYIELNIQLPYSLSCAKDSPPTLLSPSKIYDN
jgi:hypothetical protein